MRTFQIIPYEGISYLFLDEKREKIREQLHEFNYTSFIRTVDSEEPPIDYYHELGLMINYDKNFQCECIEIVLPANPVLQNMDLLSMPYIESRDWFQKNDPDFVKEDIGFTSYKFGLGIFTDTDDLTALPAGIIVFRKGYYDEC